MTAESTLYSMAVGLVAGTVGTAVMTALQFPFFKRWGLAGILEWHENVCILARLRVVRSERLLAWSFLLHFLNGGLPAMFYVVAVVGLGLVPHIDPLILGILYGVVLWILTLYPIHKPITGVSLHSHPLGRKPIILSILVHVVYGITTTYVAVRLLYQV